MRAKDKAARDAGDTWDVLTDEERTKAIELTKIALRAKRMGKLFLRLGANKKGIENGLRGIRALLERQEIYLAAEKRALSRVVGELAAALLQAVEENAPAARDGDEGRKENENGK